MLEQSLASPAPRIGRQCWDWANCYWRDDIAGSVAEGQRLQAAANYQVSNAGFGPMTLGRLSRRRS